MDGEPGGSVSRSSSFMVSHVIHLSRVIHLTRVISWLAVSVVFVASVTSEPAQSSADMAARYRDANAPRILREFAELVSLPNRARDTADIERNATYIRDQMQAAGVTTELLRVDSAPPIVFGALTVPGATRTLGIYAHYDGQPVDPKAWRHPPFEPTLYTAAVEAGGKPRALPTDGETVDPEWRIYARSAGDDKAPIAAILNVLKAFRDAAVRPTSNLIFLFDGEEEAGSPHLGEYLTRYRERMSPIDIWLFFDGPVHQSGRPQITFGVRGSMGLEVTVYGATRELHSGHYGNWAPDTPLVLARLLASMKDDQGKVCAHRLNSCFIHVIHVIHGSFMSFP